jgi:hypothetical protein
VLVSEEVGGILRIRGVEDSRIQGLKGARIIVKGREKNYPALEALRKLPCRRNWKKKGVEVVVALPLPDFL